jgi:chemotaxis protein CheD
VNELNVHIGELKVARRGERLKAILGSCVGIGLMWPEKTVCGLAHCLLPEMTEKSFVISGRYVDQALPSLLAMMRIRTNDYPNVQAIIAGGGNMTSHNSVDTKQLIGTKNYEVALRLIHDTGIPLVFVDVGGNTGRHIIINSNDYTYDVVALPRFKTGKEDYGKC